MRVLFLTIGRGPFLHGSCLHDNALATELGRRGLKVDFFSVFTRLCTDELRVTRRRVPFGGLSLLLQSQVPLFRWTPRALDRLWDNRVTHDALEGQFSHLEPSAWADRDPSSSSLGLAGSVLVSALRGRDGELAKEIDRLLDSLRRSRPDVVILPHGFLLGLARPLKERYGCKVVGALRNELALLGALDRRYSFDALELIRQNLAHVDALVARRQSAVQTLVEWFAVPASRVHVVLPSLNLRGFAPPSPVRGERFVVGYFGRIAPEKGVHLLCDAYVRLREQQRLPECRFELAGTLHPRHATYLEVMRQRMQNAGLGNEFGYRGATDRVGKFAFLSTLDVFSMPATSDDELGLPVLEAMAAGVPVVLPRLGVFPELVTRAGGGLVVNPEDEEALASGLAMIHRDPELGCELGRRGAAGVRAHFSIEREADELIQVIERAGTAAPPGQPASGAAAGAAA